MKRIPVLFFSISFCIVSLCISAQIPFTTGNIVVSRIGDGSAALNENAFPAFLDEYSPSGVLVRSIPLPTTPIGSNKALVQAGIESVGIIPGNLNLSPDGRYLTLTGYNAGVGTLNPTLGDRTVTQRTIGVIDYNGSINTSTGLNDLRSVPLSAVTSNGTDIWVCSFASAIRYTTLGAASSVQVGEFNLSRRVAIFGGQLFDSDGGGFIAKIGTGLPQTGPQTTTYLSNNIGIGDVSQFFFADLNPSIIGNDVLYIANAGTPALQKYSLDGSGNWVSNGVIGGDADNYLGITGVVSGTSVKLFIVRKVDLNSAGSGELVTLTDNSGHMGTFSGTPTVLATAGTNMTFRGVAMAPAPPSVSVSVKVYLQGAYNSGLGRHKDVTIAWRDILNNNALSQPFNVAPFNYAGTESVSAGFFTSNAAPINTDILDWVLLELHDATTPGTVVARRACFIREDGQIVDIDGTSNPTFTGVGANNYYIVIKHRNHLTIRSSSTVFVNGAAPTLYDFTTAQSKAYQNGAIVTNPAMKDLTGGGTVFGMWGGNANMNTTVRASGAIGNNDYLYINNIVLGGNTANILTPVYNSGDLNLDGQVRASGALTNNDYLILVNLILGGNTANIYTEHQ